MNALLKVTFLGALLLSWSGGGAGYLLADVPQKQEQLVYSVVMQDGPVVQSTFVTEKSDTMYLLADVDNFVSAGKTLVYYWPLTYKWKTDGDTLDVPLAGSLVISGRQRLILTQLAFTHRSATSEYGTSWKSYIGESAQRESSDYKIASEALAQKVIAYSNLEKGLNAERQRLIDAMRTLTRNGKTEEAQRLVAQYNSLVEPEPPLPLGYEVRPVQVAFDVNVPEGTYSIHIEDPSGAVVEGSDKRLVVFSPRNAGMVGYDIIPGDRWTHTEESSRVNEVIYTNGASDIYLRPFEQAEFNDLCYSRMVDNQSFGSPRTFRWVRSRQIQNSKLHVRTEVVASTSKGMDGFETIAESPYFVQQAAGASLGYTIIPFDESQPEQQGYDPSLVAFHLPTGSRRISLYLSRPDGSPYPGSEREIRVLRQDYDGKKLFLIALLPLSGLILPLVRRLKIGKG